MGWENYEYFAMALFIFTMGLIFGYCAGSIQK